jgi:drug/metabolite transporter (DMT)-like permease
MSSVNTTLVNYSSRVVPAGVTTLMFATIPLMIGVLDAALPNGRRMTAISWTAIVTGFLGLAVLISGSIVGSRRRVQQLGHVQVWRSPPPLGRQHQPGGWCFNGRNTCVALDTPCVDGCAISRNMRLVGELHSHLFMLRNVRLSTVATYAYVNPVVAVVLGSLLLNESLQAMQLAGMIIVLVSVAAVAAPKPSRQKAESEGDVQYQNPSLKETS